MNALTIASTDASPDGLHAELLGGERARYGAQLLDPLGLQRSQEFGRGFEARNLRRMLRFAQAFPDADMVSTLSTQLSWSHLVAIVPLKLAEARQFYAAQAAQEAWGVRALTRQIERKAFERQVIASTQAGVAQVPAPGTAAQGRSGKALACRAAGGTRTFGQTGRAAEG